MTVEREITHTINEALRDFEDFVIRRGQAAYIVEHEWIAEAQRLLDAGKLSQEQFGQLATNINDNTDKVVAGLHESTREILAKFRAIFTMSLLKKGGAA